MRLHILPLVTLIATTIASGDSIMAAMTAISESTISLNDTIASWKGNILGTIHIIADSAALLESIKAGTKTAKESEELTIGETISVARATRQLATDVVSSLDTVVAAEAKFDRLLLGPVILLNLKLEQSASKDFSAAVIEKVPEALRPTAQALVKPIDTAFDKSIEAYRLFKIE